jgi:hypothetical protein
MPTDQGPERRVGQVYKEEARRTFTPKFTEVKASKYLPIGYK